MSKVMIYLLEYFKTFDSFKKCKHSYALANKMCPQKYIDKSQLLKNYHCFVLKINSVSS